MKIGTFMMPNNPAHRSIRDGHLHNLENLVFLDQIGFDEAWIGEHYTTPREPCPSPDLLIAQALDKTSNITFATGAFLLPYHHPAELAARICYLDHMAEGRLIVGVGAGGFPGDFQMFDVDAAAGENRDMMAESLEIMIKFWTSTEPFEYVGKYWTTRRPVDKAPTEWHMKPFQDPFPQIGMTALSPGSSTLAIAGEKGFLPVSLGLSNSYLAEHWDTVSTAADKAGRTADNALWRIGRDVMIAETDAEARRNALDGPIGEAYRNYLLPLFKGFGFLSVFKVDPDMADSDVTLEYLADNIWLVGSPETVTGKLGDMVDESGGFGCLLVNGYDYVDHKELWQASQKALISEVAPKFSDEAAAAQ